MSYGPLVSREEYTRRLGLNVSGMTNRSFSLSRFALSRETESAVFFERFFLLERCTASYVAFRLVGWKNGATVAPAFRLGDVERFANSLHRETYTIHRR